MKNKQQDYSEMKTSKLLKICEVPDLSPKLIKLAVGELLKRFPDEGQLEQACQIMFGGTKKDPMVIMQL